MSYRFVFWILMGRSLLLRDRELVSSCKFVWLAMMSFRCIGGVGCLTDFFLESGGPISFDWKSVL